MLLTTIASAGRRNRDEPGVIGAMKQRLQEARMRRPRGKKTHQRQGGSTEKGAGLAPSRLPGASVPIYCLELAAPPHLNVVSG